jgi:hypothetical protein
MPCERTREMPRTYVKSRGERVHRGSLFVQHPFGNYSSLLFPRPYQPSPEGVPGRPAHRPFEDCSAFAHVAAHTLAGSPSRDPLTSASDISSPPCLLQLLPAGTISPGRPCTHWKARLLTAHLLLGPSRGRPWAAQGGRKRSHGRQDSDRRSARVRLLNRPTLETTMQVAADRAEAPAATN